MDFAWSAKTYPGGTALTLGHTAFEGFGYLGVSRARVTQVLCRVPTTSTHEPPHIVRKSCGEWQRDGDDWTRQF
jgi:hypothetical protein